MSAQCFPDPDKDRAKGLSHFGSWHVDLVDIFSTFVAWASIAVMSEPSFLV